ncbi:hypothetical protein BUALT_Bualt15G0072700 [Buddleja alternifolia]|uniref:Uncharacterized protein n=1 Tax=Buddleja alternifolia TaxID=168488 RepID=A0AAV6WDM7_9LAMI|nr:hypothetical protein BUALT_Bualt15G0072700 [Buddleja alternifolia]
MSVMITDIMMANKTHLDRMMNEPTRFKIIGKYGEKFLQLQGVLHEETPRAHGEDTFVMHEPMRKGERHFPCASREKVGHRNDTVLHLCVKYGTLEALEILVPNLNGLLGEENDDGDTILHMAVRDRRIEVRLT